VPETAIQVEDHSINTKENAEFSLRRLRALKSQRVILTTSWYHSRRALKCFRHFGPELTLYSCPAPFDARDGGERV